MSSFGFAIASKMLVEGKKKVRFMYRDPAVQPFAEDDMHDSGWRFFCGDESQEYVDKPENLGIYDIRTIVELDQDVEEFLSSPPGAAFERNDAGLPFAPAEQFDLPSEQE